MTRSGRNTDECSPIAGHCKHVGKVHRDSGGEPTKGCVGSHWIPAAPLKDREKHQVYSSHESKLLDLSHGSFSPYWLFR
jgi:hypothetical protein